MESMMRDSESVRIQSKTTGNNGKRSTPNHNPANSFLPVQTGATMNRQRTTTTPDWLQTKNFGFMT